LHDCKILFRLPGTLSVPSGGMIADESVAQFVALTACGADEARGYLEMANGDLQAAMNLFLEMGGGGASPVPQPAAPLPAQGGGSGTVDPSVAAEVAAVAAAAGIDTGPMDVPEPMDDDEVRAPMPAYQDQIINPEMERRRMQEAIQADSEAMSRRMSFDRPTDSSTAGRAEVINQLFAAPSYNVGKPYYEAIEQAKSEGKWVLVNIQQAEVFASHQLNRDVWSDDTIKDVVIGSFLFWQRDDKSTEGDQFCQMHQCGHQLPHICVIDPRTGRRVKAWDGRKWVESHAAAEYLFGFLDEFSLSRSPPANSPAASPSVRPQAPPAVATGSAGGDVALSGLDDDMGTEAAPPAAPQEPAAAMPDEPAEDVEHIKVCMRMPEGQRITRRFLSSDPLEQMFAVASATLQQPISRLNISTQFPKRSLRDTEGGLQALMKDAGVAGNMVLVTVQPPS